MINGYLFLHNNLPQSMVKLFDLLFVGFRERLLFFLIIGPSST